MDDPGASPHYTVAVHCPQRFRDATTRALRRGCCTTRISLYAHREPGLAEKKQEPAAAADYCRFCDIMLTKADRCKDNAPWTLNPNTQL